MQLRHYVSLLRRRWFVLLLAAVAAVGLAVVASPGGARYQARSTIYVGSQNFDLDAPQSDIYGRTLGLDRLIQTFSAMIDTETLAREAALLAGVGDTPEDIVAATTVTRLADTQLLYIDVQDEDPRVARDIANGLADAFVVQVQQFEPVDDASPDEGTVPRVPASIFERAVLPTDPLPTGLLVNMVLAMVLGVSAAVGVLFLLDYLDVTVRSPADAERRLGLPVLGSLPDFEGVSRRSSLLRRS